MNLKLFFVLVCISALVVGCKSESNKKNEETSKRPNILFAISDDQSYLHTSFAGSNFVKTPAFDRVAREGMYFSNCYAGSPGCAPSRSALITGRHHWQNEQSGQHYCSWMTKHVPFVDELKDNGYAVGRTGKGVDPFQYARNGKDSLWRKENAAGPDYTPVTYKNKEELPAKGISTNNYFENFKYFMQEVREDKPFFFWYGGHEPHRVYEEGSWKKRNKDLKDVDVPEFFPDNNTIRGDLADYAVEIEWFDLHLEKILDYLDEIGELDNTIVIVTADNGMPFPRAKASAYDYGIHVPLAIRYPDKIKKGTVKHTPVGFVDFAPTILEATSTIPKKMLPITGKSIWNFLQTSDEDLNRAVYTGRERHTTARYKNWGYPQRSIRQGDYLLVWNMKPERWPVGAPQRFSRKDTTVLQPMYGLNKQGKFVYGEIFRDAAPSPSRTFLIENHNSPEHEAYFKLAFDKRPEFELFNLKEDPGCIRNLSGQSKYEGIAKNLKETLVQELKLTKDPRVVGPDHDIFDSYKRYSNVMKFPKPAYIED
ncbi:sulfatase [Tamlana sp. 2201CG12-4]|uniref:sulfatase family protein n=1 Tax=Tamlana sp. 2201CG12-4 TaxID=3112582 RepID=UPI002DBF3B69|nr:sulfatase [Tamlana sp. 2201CG12-4]MEC3908235.1 sulfatase [Tamlana sp. 2201CG12-4]